MKIPDIAHPAFPKVPRLNRDIVITEKLDGTNGIVHIDELGNVSAGSRNRWLTPENDNYGFAKWVEVNTTELLKLGPGTHYGEWWGAGIQRRYGLTEKRFSLFNVGRWRTVDGALYNYHDDPTFSNPIHGVSVVPVLASGLFDSAFIESTLENLRINGSVAAPGFNQPEGIVVFHGASHQLFKVTCVADSLPKGKVDAGA